MEDAYAISSIRNRRHVQLLISPYKAISAGFARLLGCRHSELGLPFTIEGYTYRTCMSCGLKRAFDPLKWKTIGPYYRS